MALTLLVGFRPWSAAALLAGLPVLPRVLAPIRRRLRVRRMCHPAPSPHRLHPRLSCRLPARRLRWSEVWASFVLNLAPYRWVRSFLQLSQWFQVFLHLLQALGYLPWPRHSLCGAVSNRDPASFIRCLEPDQNSMFPNHQGRQWKQVAMRGDSPGRKPAACVCQVQSLQSGIFPARR
jgi:hypothetical protein